MTPKELNSLKEAISSHCTEGSLKAIEVLSKILGSLPEDISIPAYRILSGGSILLSWETTCDDFHMVYLLIEVDGTVNVESVKRIDYESDFLLLGIPEDLVVDLRRISQNVERYKSYGHTGSC